MLTTEIRCPGCDRPFRPRGLAQHISKTRDARCRGVGAPLPPQAPTVSYPHMVSTQTIGPFPGSEASGGGEPDDNSDTQFNTGEFTATRAVH